MQKITRMASRIQLGQRLQGRKTYYDVVDRYTQTRDNLWIARWRSCASAPIVTNVNRDPNAKFVLIKTAPLARFNNEVEALNLCQGHKSVRQLLDVTDSPQSMVLEFLDKNLYEASCEQQLNRQDIKRAGKAALEGLSVLHDKKRAHTGQLKVTVLASSIQIR